MQLRQQSNFLSSGKVFYSVLLVCTAFVVYTVLTASGTFDPGDGINHYLFARYAWIHHSLFLHHWGKPLFILLSSPFAQFGLTGVAVFNILCGAATVIFVERIAHKTGIGNRLLVPVFVLFAPIYFGTLNSALTEPLFGAVLCGAIWAAVEKKYILSAVLISFLPFVRSEGYLIMPLFGLYFLLYRKYAAIPFLAAGWIVYAIAGWFVFDDFLWQLHQNPYRGAADAYGHGNLGHFFNSLKETWGIPLFWLFWIGILLLLYRAAVNFRKLRETGQHLPELMLLVGGSFCVYLLAHVFFWWQGLFGSLGMIRVLAAVMPCASLIGLWAYGMLTQRINSFAVKLSLTLIVATAFISVPFSQKYWPYRKGGEEKTVEKMAAWMKTQPLNRGRIYYGHPCIPYLMNSDPFDSSIKSDLCSAAAEVGNGAMKTGDLIIWDAHFGPKDCMTPVEKFLNDSRLELVKKITPDEPFKVWDVYEFEIYIFRRK